MTATMVCCAIVHGDTPDIFLADDLETLHWVLALQLVAQSRADQFTEGTRTVLRDALLAERWADAVTEWMSATGQAIDVYPSHVVYSTHSLPPDLAAIELQFTPLFRTDT
jgi:hypothetical protein